MKTTFEIIELKDDYISKYIDMTKDWSIEHDKFFNEEWCSKDELIKIIQKILNEHSWSKDVNDFLHSLKKRLD